MIAMEYKIQIENGESFSVSAEEDTLLRGALRADIGLPHECSVGGCGACRFELAEGSMETLWAEAPGLSDRDRRRGKRLACQSRPTSDCTIRVRCSSEYLPIVAPQRRTAVLTHKRELTRDMTEFTFRAEGNAEFRPGQYALLYLPETSGPRAYSMSNLPNDQGIWQFVVRRVPGGKGSGVLFDAVQVGDSLAIDGPYGHAFLREDNPREIVCIAGGSGLAPMLSIARRAMTLDVVPHVHFFDGARTRLDLCGGEMLTESTQRGTKLGYTPVLSNIEPGDDWAGARGFVHEAVAAGLTGPLDRYEFYFAGPPPMIEAVQTMLMTTHQVPYQQIHFDRFV